MRILNWMQNKLTGRLAEKKPTVGSSNRYPMPEAPKEEFSDWPQALLAIGTFGNSQLKENPETNEIQEDPEAQDASENLSNFTEEEVGKLQKELTKLLALKLSRSRTESGREKANLPLDKFLNCPSSLELDRSNCLKFCDDLTDKESELSRNSSVIVSKGKEVHADKKVINQKSISFLLKKMFACQKGCSPSHSLRDPVAEPRMEKLLKAILQKKIHHQNSGSTSTRKKYLTSSNRHTPKKETEDESKEKINDQYKWVKTDSDFIVLEI